MGNLTDVQIRSWIKAEQPIAKADGGGLTFTLSAKKTAAWVLRYRFGGKGRELTIGRYPDIPLAKARELATEHRSKIQQGLDVAREKQKASIERATAKTFRELADDYTAKAFPKLAPSTARQRGYQLKNIVLPKLGGLPAREVTTGDIVSLVEIVGRRSQAIAEQAFTAISEIFNMASRDMP